MARPDLPKVAGGLPPGMAPSQLSPNQLAYANAQVRFSCSTSVIQCCAFDMLACATSIEQCKPGATIPAHRRPASP